MHRLATTLDASRALGKACRAIAEATVRSLLAPGPVLALLPLPKPGLPDVPTSPRSARVLILTPQPLLAALLGMLLELEQFEPVFAEPDETPEDAIARVRPLLVVLLDGDLDAARSDLFFARAAKRGIRVVLFQPPGGGTHAREIAEARALPWFTLPIDRANLARILGDGTPRTRAGRERRRASVSMASDGSMIFDDASGRRWVVYDRRGTDRRGGGEALGAGANVEDANGYRAFVSETGEEWRVPFTAEESLAVTPGALAEQLARASLVTRGQ